MPIIGPITFTQKLAFLAGSWNVKVEAPCKNNTWHMADQTSSNAALFQLSIYNITPDAFMMDIKNSVDKGATWRPAYKLTCNRK
ncbi:MAG: hypothetical protein KKG99_07310 [Bacteroidetes bacterium]|nr:hypothetical protein [Bacteroidota bacterium]